MVLCPYSLILFETDPERLTQTLGELLRLVSPSGMLIVGPLIAGGLQAQGKLIRLVAGLRADRSYEVALNRSGNFGAEPSSMTVRRTQPLGR